MSLPDWLDLGKIGQLGIIIMMIVQYIKAQIPDKYIKYVAIGIGILVSILCECYIGGIANIPWIKAIVNGILAAILADTGYQFLSSKGGGNFTLPSKGAVK